MNDQPEPDVDDQGARHDLGVELLHTVARLNRWANRRADLQIPPAQGRILALLNELGSSRIGDLAEADHCSQPTMTTQVQKLEALGWVRRQTDPGDARARRIEVTAEGERVLVSARTARGDAVRDHVEGLSARDREVLADAVAIMERMVRGD